MQNIWAVPLDHVSAVHTSQLYKNCMHYQGLDYGQANHVFHLVLCENNLHQQKLQWWYLLCSCPPFGLLERKNGCKRLASDGMLKQSLLYMYLLDMVTWNDD